MGYDWRLKMKSEQEYIKYNLIARISYIICARPAFRYLESIYDNEDITIIKKKSKQKYKEMLARTPSLGKYTAMLLMPIVMLSIYKATESSMEESVFAEMLINVAQTPLFLKMATNRKLFTEKFHVKTENTAAMSKTLSYPISWVFDHEVISSDEYLTTYSRCGLCELAEREHCFELAKYFCKIDYITYDRMGAILDRKMTIADGDKVCDFHVIRKKGNNENE